ncbi:Plasmodium variant antigen protein Cir/Yir/Bir, putative [Plasmodium chabaudi adami]|uniref:Plasmodium variant antigen protein Cir/Yir/Bir, putative n=1 Tax=Plasmodium chabaudi adami TaxID=5826 RepID=A0A1C6WZP8_PLACE|nr:Plasmodium variant antigen protein Cir/Yir/Bir, putative [Plasmodium chabaudi adami]
MELDASNLFREVDKLFVGKSIDTKKFYYDYKITQYCPEDDYKGCYSDYQRINAIGAHVIMELIHKNQIVNGMDDRRHIDYFIMWLSHILYRKFEDHTITLNSAYDKYLKNNFGNFRHWRFLDDKIYLTHSNIAIMNIFYLLFQQIFDTIKGYRTKNVLGYEDVSNAFECYIIYNQLFKYINPCSPYRELLVNLKTIYNDFIKMVKRENSHRDDILDQLMELPPIEKTEFGHDFKSRGCKRIHQKLENKTSKLIQMGNKMLKDDAERKAQSRSNSIASQYMKHDDYYYYYDNDDYDDDDGDDDVNDDDDVVDDVDGDLGNNDDITKSSSNQEQNSQQGAPPVSAPKTQQTITLSSKPSGTSTSAPAKPLPTKPAHPQKGKKTPKPAVTKIKVKKTKVKNPKVTKPASTKPKPAQSPSVKPEHAKPAYAQPVQGRQIEAEQKTPPLPPSDSLHTSQKSGENHQSGTNNSENGSDFSKNGKNSLGSGKRNGDDGSNGSGNPGGKSKDDAPNKINHGDNFTSVPKVSSQKLGSGNKGNVAGTAQSADSKSAPAPPQPKQPPNTLPPTAPGASTTPSTHKKPEHVKQTPPEAPKISQPSKTPSEEPVPPPPSKESPKALPSASGTSKTPGETTTSSTKSTSPIQNDDSKQLPRAKRSVDSGSLINTPTTQSGTAGDQSSVTAPSPPPVKPSNTGNGSTTETSVKINEKPSIWCIGTNRKCNIIGIGIIGISIFIVLAFMFKYLSFGSRKKSKKKKITKKVINLVDGKKMEKKFIKSIDREKKSKIVVNSDDNKKIAKIIINSMIRTNQ